MTDTVIDEDATRAELVVDVMRMHTRVEEIETTGRGYDKTRDEYHETTQTEFREKIVECPVTRIYNEETGEEVTVDELEKLIDSNGMGKVERVDYDEARYMVDGVPYLAVYDMSPFENLR